MPYGIEIVNKDEDTADLLIYGYITDEKWYDEDVTPKEFKRELDKLKNKKSVNVRINSGGGGVFAGMAIYNMLKTFKGETNGIVDGIAASIASVILQGCKNRIVPKNGLVMIHNPSSVAIGDANAFRKEAEILDKVKDAIIATYTERSSLKENKIKKMMDDETWMTGEEAVSMGFADKVEELSNVKACLQDGKMLVNGQEFDEKRYKSFPKDRIKIENTVIPEPEKQVQEPLNDMDLFELQHVNNLN